MNFEKQLCSVLTEVTGASQWIHLFPMGVSQGWDGRGPYILRDKAHAEKVIAASLREKVDLMIDRDHQKDLLPAGTVVLAAGWMKEFQVRDDGIWARAEWTETATAQLNAKELRYISPVFSVNKDTRMIGRIMRASLTNTPNLELTAVASAQTTQTSDQEENDSMDKHLLAIATLMAITSPANADAIVTAAQERFTQLETLQLELASIKKAVGAKEDAVAKDVVELATALVNKKTETPDPAKFVPIAQFNELASQVADLNKHRATASATEAVEQAMRDGKVSPAMKSWAMDYATSDLAKFQEYLKTAPQIVTAGQQQPGTAVAGKDGLTAEEIEICSQMGISQEEFKKTKEAEAKTSA